ncbi:discoidin domain-containing protein [Pedobacter mendelii]|uniref:F5/8 type C domain-containing protein n=1 Tax=Pedobacter mendelii TaxID=1908240 RepID=A0ABQ2BDW9_9SPHI|nr:discoidin domain-containing protein [Pedobacter mendelii]GGI23870.1 hypothetical protein GCM10008119_09820 [Pedobacter mendelii]
MIYNFHGLPRGHVAEIRYYRKDKGGKEILVAGRAIGNIGRYGSTRENVYDNDPLSYFVPEDNKEEFIALDLGKGNESTVTKIKYWPRNDDNSVKALKVYSLYYWDDVWKKISESKANQDKKIVFKDVTGNSLLLLKENNRGLENRIFTYKNDKQIFW